MNDNTTAFGTPDMVDACAVSEPPVFTTRVGLAVHGDNLFRGHSVRDELVGKRGFWQMMALALGGPQLSPFQCQLFDALTASASAADPRIWPLKMTRVAGAYGGMWAALSSAFVINDGSSVGCNPCIQAAEFFERVHALTHDEGMDDMVAVLARVREEQGGRLAGFGVPGRDSDERFEAMVTWFDANRPENYPTTYWKILQQMRPIMVESLGLQMNLLTCVTALCLDMGFNPSQVVVMGFLTVLPCYFGNAYEATCEPESMLPERMGSTSVRYVGKPSSTLASQTEMDPR